MSIEKHKEITDAIHIFDEQAEFLFNEFLKEMENGIPSENSAKTSIERIIATYKTTNNLSWRLNKKTYYRYDIVGETMSRRTELIDILEKCLNSILIYHNDDFAFRYRIKVDPPSEKGIHLQFAKFQDYDKSTLNLQKEI